MAMAQDFERDRYVIVPDMIPAEVARRVYAYTLDRQSKGDLMDAQVPNTPSFYGDPVMESLLADLLPRMQEITGLRLFPTYSYFRVYKRGDVLEHHTDRGACEVSVTITIGADGDVIWPIFIRNPAGKESRAVLPPGAGMVYRGCECDHWRDRYVEGDRQSQVFLHYVDADGSNAEFKYDKRASLSDPKGSTVESILGQ